jgi:two-component system response regulator AtoC
MRNQSIMQTDPMIGFDPTIEWTRELIRKFADSSATVLITGETGTGKELVARALVQQGARRNKPFVVVNCAAMTEAILESELFGHERGAFSGAGRATKGLFAEAADGTVFLDEIGDIPAPFQRALLRVLDAGEIRAVGSAAARTIRCRIIAATNANLERMVAEGRFRMDLLFRLQRLCIHLPPLRERRDDIPWLAEHFLQANRRTGSHAMLSAEATECLLAYDWPGNIRELRNVIERMCLVHPDMRIYTPAELGAMFQTLLSETWMIKDFLEPYTLFEGAESAYATG